MIGRRRISVGLLAAGALTIAACGGSDDAADESVPPSSEVSEPEPESAATVPEPVDTEPATTTTEVPEPEPESEPTTSVESPTTTTGEPEPEPGPDWAQVEALVADFVTERGLNGAGLAVVDADDGVVYEEYWGEFNADRVSFIASSSKQITAGVLLRLDDEGVLDIDAPVGDIVGAAWGEGVGDRTIAQMLSNSSGLVGLGPNPAYPPYLCQFLATQEIEACGQTIFTTPDDDADIVEPDTEFRYGGAQWQLAGAIAEFASGESWAELIQRIYVEPCDLGDDFGYNNHWTTLGGGSFEYPAGFDGDLSKLAPTENPHMEGGVYATVPDYAQLLLAHLRGGECPNGTVVSQRALDVMHADRVASAYDGDADGANTGYGMGWWVNRETGRISDGGAYGSQPWLDLDDGYGAYLVVEADTVTGSTLAAQLEPVIHDLMAS